MKTKKQFPSYHITKPKYPSLHLLYDNLAFQDAGFQSNQILIEFFDTYTSENNIETKPFIRELAQRYKLSAGTEDFSRIRKMMAQSYIVQTYNIAELFFKEFNKSYKKVHNISTWKKTVKIGNKDKNLDPLNQFLKNLDTTLANHLKNLPEYHLCNYYRYLRNSYVHREVDEKTSLKKPKDYYLKYITQFNKHFEKYYKIIPDGGAPAPNTPDAITFQDFILFSRALRNLANYINDLIPLSVEKVFSLSEEDSKFLLTPRKINYKKFPNSKGQLDDYLTNYYKAKFGNVQSDIDEFMKLFYDKY